MADSPMTVAGFPISDLFSLALGASPLFVTGEDNLLVQYVDLQGNAQPITVTVRRLGPDGTIVPTVHNIPVVASATLQTAVLPLDEGVLLSVDALGGANSTLSGGRWCELQLIRGLSGATQRELTIASGYITATICVAYPGPGARRYTEGEGLIQRWSVGNPAAGADWTFSVGGTFRMELLSVYAVLTTSAAAANRQVRLFLDDGANAFFCAPAPANETASLAWQNSWGAGAGGPVIADPSAVSSPIPNGLMLLNGWRVRTTTAGIQAADQWSAISLMTRMWFDK